MIAIVGAGAIGQQLAYQLYRLDQAVAFLSRSQTTTIQPHSIQCLDQAIRHYEIPHWGQQQSLKSLTAVLICTKAYQAIPTLESLLPRLQKNCPVLLLHNGMGPQEEAIQRWPEHNIWIGSIADAAKKLSPNTVQQTGSGLKYYGTQQINPLPLPTALLQIGFQLHDSIDTLLWQKLSVNAVINPLTSLYQIENGQLCHPQYQPMIHNLCHETAQVMHREGVTESCQDLIARVNHVAHCTAKNSSSMLQDIRTGRQTELFQITGYLLARAQQHQIKAIFHQQIFDAMTHLAHSKGIQ